MNRSSLIPCVILSCAIALPGLARAQQAPAVQQIEVRHVMPVATACPAVFAVLPERLHSAWRAIDAAAEVSVDFNLDGDQIRNVAVAGGHGDYAGHVRSAVKSMACRADGKAAVRFLISFVYPEDGQGAQVAVRLVDLAPRVAAR